jgi:dihydrofolate synthase/folylpolyglutamate synthase
LGGRLDSTTAANASIVGITSIAFDHEEYLGDTIESIAAEKAAIIRPGVRAVIARQHEPAALNVLLKRCEQVGVTPVLAESIATDGLVLGLRGEHQKDNAAVAVGLAELLRTEGFAISDSAIVDGLKTANHAARLELIPHKPSFLIDGAHNPAGADSLRAYLDQFATRPLTLVFGAMRDKQLEQMGEILFPVADTLVLTTIDNPRSASLEMLQSIASRFAKGTVLESESSTEALRIALENTLQEGLICIAGSLYLAGEMRPLILSLGES